MGSGVLCASTAARNHRANASRKAAGKLDETFDLTGTVEKMVSMLWEGYRCATERLSPSSSTRCL
jgi:hypothetical protein